MTRSLFILRSAILVGPFACAACAQGSNGGLGLDDFGDAAPGSMVEAGSDDSAEPSGGGDDDATGKDEVATGDDAAAGDDLPDATTGGGGEDAMSGTGLDSGPDSAFETSSDGALCSCGAQSVCVAGTCTAARRVFVSNETYAGTLGGHAGADATCQALATGAALGGTWMAWISDATSSPSQRFSIPTVGYYLLDGTPVATSWAALTASGPIHAIDLTETGASLATASANASKTWTATLVTGALGTASCSDFGSSDMSETGEVGHCTGTGTVNWTSAYTTEQCNVSNHLYCFEQ